MSDSETKTTKETVAEFLARGGKIEVLPPRTAIQILRTFSARKIRSANTENSLVRSRRAENKAGYRLR